MWLPKFSYKTGYIISGNANNPLLSYSLIIHQSVTNLYISSSIEKLLD